MAKKSKKKFLSLDILIVFVFCICVIVFGVLKWQAVKMNNRAKLEKQIKAKEKNDSISELSKLNVDTSQEVEKSLLKEPNEIKLTKLYVTIDGLNIRTAPHLDSTVIEKLSLFEPVFFLNEITEFKQKINLGTSIVEFPWIKIKTQKGKTGWGYGAGLNYYKEKRNGVY